MRRCARCSRRWSCPGGGALAADLTLSGGTAGPTGDYHLDTSTNTWHIHPLNNSTVITIIGSTTSQKVVVDSGKTARVKLSNATIAPSGPTTGLDADRGKGRPLSVSPNATLYLTLEGTNTLRAPLYSTALFCPRYATLFIDGTGTLNAETSESFGVAAIGGEGRINQTVYDWVGEVTTREWENSDDSAWCGKITINSGIVNAKVNSNKTTGEDSDTVDVAMEYMLYNWSVAIGGINGGPIVINGNSLTSTQVTATGGDKSTGIGSLSPLFEGGIKITGGTVKAYTNAGPNSNNAMSDHNTGGSYGAAIGWAAFGVHGGFEYNGSVAPGDSKIVIDITGGKVEAYGGWGCAGIGGGRNGSGGYIHIGGTADVNAKGGTSAAGIGGGIAFNPCLASTTMGTGTILIDGSAVVTAVGGTHAAGIGGGGCRNNTAKAGNRNEAHSGTIIIAGNADVTATGSYNGPAIGSGGGMSSQNSTGACKVQGITITTTVPVKTYSNGTGAITNIGPGAMPDNSSDSPNQSPTDRFTGAYINTNPTQQDPKITVNDSITIDSNGDLIVTGNVDITSSQFTESQAKVISQGILDYLSTHDGKVIKSATSGAAVKLATGYTVPTGRVQSVKVEYGTPQGGSDPVITAPDPNIPSGGGGQGTGGGTTGGGGQGTGGGTTGGGGQGTGGGTTGGGTGSGGGSGTDTPGTDTPGTDTPGGGTTTDPEQDTYKPDTMTPTERVEHIDQQISALPGATSDTLDTGTDGGSGFNITLSAGDGSLQMVSNDKGQTGNAWFTEGQNIVQEIYLLKPGDDGKPELDASASLEGTKVTVEVGYQDVILYWGEQTITGGHMSIKVETDVLIRRLKGHLSVSETGDIWAAALSTYDLWMRISNKEGGIDTTLPISLTFDASDVGTGGGFGEGGSGGGGCAASAGVLGFAVLAAMKRRR